MIDLDMNPVKNNQEKYVVHLLPMNQIWSDPSFNCRGAIAPADVIELAKDIATRGLDSPIIVKPCTEKPGIQWKVVAGHRRHLAFVFNNTETIPAIIRPDLDELEARLLNIRENLHRKNLNIKQEAHALKYFFDYKRQGSEKSVFTVQMLASTFGQTRAWVQNRIDLLKLPEDIQDEAAAGMISQGQIKVLANLKDKTELYAFVRKIKETKLRGEKIRLTPSITRASEVLKARERDRSEINELQELIYDTIGPCLTTRVMAWAQGEISTAAVMIDLRKHCEENDIKFKMPDFIETALNHNKKKS